jgi:hypothetical protein
MAAATPLAENLPFAASNTRQATQPSVFRDSNSLRREKIGAVTAGLQKVSEFEFSTTVRQSRRWPRTINTVNNQQNNSKNQKRRNIPNEDQPYTYTG